MAQAASLAGGLVGRLLGGCHVVFGDGVRSWPSLHLTSGKSDQIRTGLGMAARIHRQGVPETCRPTCLECRRPRPGILCNFNDVEVYGALLEPGESMLLTREAFRELAFQRYADGRYFEPTYTARSDTLHSQTSSEATAESGGRWVDAARLRYAQDTASNRRSG